MKNYIQNLITEKYQALQELSIKKLKQYKDATTSSEKDREKGYRLATNKIRASQKETKKYGPTLYHKVVDKKASAKDLSIQSKEFKPKIPASKK